jgi:excisionase family DNA binding protein
MSSMKVGDLREHLAAAAASAMRRPEPEAVALTIDRTKAMAVALSGMDPEAEVDPETLAVGTRHAAIILGFHPEHVRRLIRSGRLRATLTGGDYRIALSDLWPFLEVRYRQPGRRRIQPRR